MNEISGSMQSIYGAWIGIPVNYFYTTVDDIPKNQLLVNSNPIDWDQDSGQMLQHSLVLTDSEKLFAFCRSLFELKSYRVVVNTLIVPVVVIGTYTLGAFLNIKYKMFRRPFYVSVKAIGLAILRIHTSNIFFINKQVRYATYPVVGLIGYGIFGVIAYLYAFQRERSIDKKLANLGPGELFEKFSFFSA